MNLPFLTNQEILENTKIIAFGGPQRAGKGETIYNLMPLLGSDWSRCNTSRILINEACSIIHAATGKNITPKQMYDSKAEYREFLQELSDKMEAREPAGLLKITLFCALLNGKDRLLVDSIRRKSEIELLSRFQTTFVLVEASEEIRVMRPGGVINALHTTETEGVAALRAHKDTYIIKNEGTKMALFDECQRFAHTYLAKH